MKLNKDEIESLKKYSCNVSNLQEANGQIIEHLVVISHGRKEMHDSGYPFIKIIGFTKDNKAINLGWHDHFICSVPVNIDSYGKNIFNIMPWISRGKKFKVSDNFISLSTFEIGTMFPSDDNDKYINLR